ncbi:hypothetical protein J7F02_14525 [Streptomyces sp. ISL-112]|nr:hypothetical protein [Streptomyces sp. ISL-112]MBT2461839.1 hypothetical protein [Streptomyces sp. ISL-63]
MSFAMWERQVRRLMPVFRATTSSTRPSVRGRATLCWTAVTGVSGAAAW